MSKLRVYTIQGSPPATAVLATLDVLELPYDVVKLDYAGGEHQNAEHEKRNPAKQVPVLEDNGFFVSESVAIMQYLCDQYGGKDGTKLYPRDVKQRTVVNQRLAFHLSNLYPSISAFVFGDIFYHLTGDPEERKTKFLKSMTIFEAILAKQGTQFSAGETVTIADIALVMDIMCLDLDALHFDFSQYPCTSAWYEKMRSVCSTIWQQAKSCRDVLNNYFAMMSTKPNAD